MTKIQPAVCYYRVSTRRQGESGLSLDAQKRAAHRFLAGRAPLGEFVEVESATRKKDRPQLRAALELCRERKALLVIAKLDRLARNVLFIATLMESGVKFVCLDLPEATPLTLHILAAVAEDEARTIAQRTKTALVEAKRRGVRLGNPRARDFAHLGGAGRAKRADRFALEAMPAISRLCSRGVTSPKEIAEELTAWKVKTPSGGRNAWSAGMVRRVLRRAERFTSDYAIEVENGAGNIDLAYSEVDGKVTRAFT